MLRWLWTACLAIAASGIAGCGDGTRPAEFYREGVARLEVRWRGAAGASKTKAIGTGFLVGRRGHLLTAQHVAEHGRSAREGLSGRLPARIVAVLPGGEAVDVTIVAEDPAADLALLEMRGRAPRVRRRLLRGELPADSEVVLSGYPIGERELLLRTGRLLAPQVVSGLLEQDAPDWISELRRGGLVLADVAVRVGDSGGPLYWLQTGEIIGLCSAAVTRSAVEVTDDIAIVVPAARIARFLEAHGVAVD